MPSGSQPRSRPRSEIAAWPISARAFRQAQPFAAIEVFGELNLPHIPSKAEIVRRARSLLANSPSMEDIAAKAHELLLEAIGTRLATLAAQSAN